MKWPTMGEIIAWLDQQHVNFGTILTSACVLVVAGLDIPLLRRFSEELARQRSSSLSFS
jgi:hypothetical protein